MAEKNEIKLPVFDGKNYNMWKKRVNLFLRYKGCSAAITREMSESDDEEDWNRKDLQAMNYIYAAISNKQLEFVQEKETAYEIIKKFDSLYLKESTALQIIYRNKLEKLRLKNYENCDTFFSDFEKAVNELKSAGATVSEKEKLNYILNALPESYSHIGDLIDTLDKDDQTADYV